MWFLDYLKTHEENQIKEEYLTYAWYDQHLNTSKKIRLTYEEHI